MQKGFSRTAFVFESLSKAAFFLCLFDYIFIYIFLHPVYHNSTKASSVEGRLNESESELP